MNSLTLSRCTLSVCAAATLLVGCGGSQPAGVAQGPVPQGQMPENPSRVSGVGPSSRSVRHASVTETVLYSFGTHGASDGAHPGSSLTYFKGTLYGTTPDGGVYCHGLQGCGTVYRITLSGAEKVLHRFTGGTDGATPGARPIVLNGTLYGTTSRRGGCLPCGTVFSITPSGHETVLHAFTGSPDGRGPVGRLLNVNGTLYGTTSSGGVAKSGNYGSGTVFSITPGGKEKVLYSFRGGTDGADPVEGLIDVKGTLYGTTDGGGAYNGGTVFSITLGGKEKVLYSFKGFAYPSGLVDVNGTLYGVNLFGGKCITGTSGGCGTLFGITPSGKETLLYNFTGGDGAFPRATLLNVNGTLYGTTAGGGDLKCLEGNYGSPGGCGTVFKFDIASGRETVLYSFMGHGSGGSLQDGVQPQSGLNYINGTFYGTTSLGGVYNGGTVYSIRP